MKIFLGELVLVGGAELNEEPINLKITSNRLVQTIYTLRADNAQPVDRGNVVVQIEFRVRRKHKSIEDAQIYTISRTSELNQLVSTLTVMPEPDGQAFYLQNATIQNTEFSLNGNISECFYKIVGGNLANEQ